MNNASQIFDGFRIIRPEIARGGMGVVHEALSPEGRRVAIKVLNRAKIEGKEHTYEKYVGLFKEEYQTLAGLNHPSIAKVMKIGFFENQFYIASEFVEGKPLAEHVLDSKPIDMIPLFVQALEGLDFIHRSGLIHLDIKSENILVQTEDGKPRVKIIDFGLAMAPSEYTGSFMGSVSTMAPEVALGKKEDVDARADLFSFACVMYQCIRWGIMPFARSRTMTREALMRAIERERLPRPPSLSHREHPERICEFLDKIVLHLLAKDPKDRFYGNARAVVNALATKSPEVFSGIPDTRAPYLKPEGNAHIGRSGEQERLFASVEALHSGESSFYVIRGLAGMGKTHLMEKVKERAARRVDELFISSIAFPANEAAFESWNCEIMKSMDDNSKPVVIFADDLQSAGGPARNTLRSLAHRISERAASPVLYQDVRPIMLCITIQDGTRSANEAEIISVNSAAIIQLAPFGEHDIKSYLESTPAFKGKEISGDWIDALYKRTDGIPRELAEHLETRDSAGLLFSPDGTIIVAGPDEGHSKPPKSTRERLTGIYQNLSVAERAILDFLAVWYLMGVTRPASMDDLGNFFYSGFLPQSVKNLAAAAILANEHGIIKWHSDYFQRIVHESIPANDREIIHDSIANYLKSDKEAVAFHTACGSDHALAVKNAIIVGRKMLFKNGSSAVACELFRHAMEITQVEHIKLRAHLMGLLSDALFYEGKLDQSLKAANSGLDFLSKIQNAGIAPKLPFHARIAVAHIQQRKYDETRSAISLGLELAQGGYPVPRLILENYRAAVLCQLSFERPNDAFNLLAEAYTISAKSLEEEKYLPKDMADRVTNNQMGIVLRAQGKLKEAAIVMEKVLKEKQHSIFSGIAANMSLAEVYRLLHNFEPAKDRASAAIALSKNIGRGEWILHAHGILSNLYYDEDRYEKAMDENRRYMAMSACVADDKQRKYISIRYCLRMGHCLRDTEKWDKATMYFGTAIDTGAQGTDLMSAEQGLGEALFRKGDKTGAMDHLLKAEELLRGLPDDPVTNSHRERIAKLKAEIATTRAP